MTSVSEIGAAPTTVSAYAAVGPTLIAFALDVAGETLVRRGALDLPARIQAVFPHPRLPVLYAACADRSAEAQAFYLCALSRDAQGELTLLGDPVPLSARPIDLTVDGTGDRLLTAYSLPAGVTLHRIEPDGRIGAELPAAADFDAGSYPHQVRVTPDNARAIVVARGKKGFGKSSYVEGELKVVRFDRGMLETVAAIQPERSSVPAGFNPRNIDFHPDRPLLFASLEEQNQLAVFDFDGTTIGASPRFVRDSLARPDDRQPRQDGGGVRVHPDGRTVYVGNRNDGYVGGGSGPGWLVPDPVPVFPGGENTIAVFAIDQDSGEPTLIQTADTHGLHPRAFALDPSGRVLIVGNFAPMVVRDGDSLTEIPANIALFRIEADGTLSFVRRYDLDTHGELLLWVGIVA